MAGEHTAENGSPAPSRARSHDVDSLRAGLARMRAGDADEAVRPERHDDEDPNVSDDDDHGDAPPARPARKSAKKPAATARAAAPAPEPDEDDEPDPDPEEREEHGDEDEPDDAAADDPALPEEETADEPEAEPDDEPRPDPEIERRAKALRRQEQRIRERNQAERAEITRDRESLRTEREELAAFKAAKARAKVDAWSALKALGWSDDDAEVAARQIYANTAEMRKDPKNREAADRLARERQRDAELEELKSWRKAEDERKAEEARVEEQRAFATRYLGSVQKAVKPGGLAAHYLRKGGKQADKVFQTFAQITQELSDDDDLPDPRDVAAEYERRRREELEDDGIDVAALLKRPATNGKKPAVAAPAANGKKPKPAAAAPASRETNGNGNGNGATRRPLDPEERKDMLLRDIKNKRKRREAFD